MNFTEYLEYFFEFYEYNKDDAAVLTDAYKKTADNREASSILMQAMDMYDKNPDRDFPKILELADEIALKTGIHEYTAELLMCICLSKKAKEVYESKGINMEYFHGNMLDLKYKLEECKLVYGIVGSFVVSWFDNYFYAKRFTMGRLQFELISFGDNYNKDGRVLTPESKVVNVHIPRTLKPLDEKSCDEAFLLAKEFFKDEFEGEIPFYCYSWLLYPENKNILPETSNTYRFISRFEITKTEIDKNLNNLWRLFDTMERDPKKLPEKSSMQRAFKNHLLNGGKMGVSAGVFFLKK